MALDSAVLAADIKTFMYSNPSDPMDYLDVIKSYVEDNIEINMTYAGIVTLPPKPVEGLTFTGKLSILPTFKSTVIAFQRTVTSPNMNSYVSQLITAMNGSLVSVDEYGVGTASPPLILTPTLIPTVFIPSLFSSAELDSIKDMRDMTDIWIKIADKITLSAKTLALVPSSIPTTSLTGTGNSTRTTVN